MTLRAFGQDIVGAVDPAGPIDLPGELKDCIVRIGHADWVKHPYITMPLQALRNFDATEILSQCAKQSARLKSAGNWGGYVFLGGRPWRLDRFIEIAPNLMGADYWRLLRAVWADAEQPGERSGDWVRLFRDCDQPGRWQALDPDESLLWAVLPEALTLFRGVSAHDAAAARKQVSEALSWTLRRDLAERHANDDLPDHRMHPFVACMTLHKRDPGVLTFLDHGHEQQVVLDPTLFRGIHVEQVPRREDHVSPGVA